MFKKSPLKKYKFIVYNYPVYVNDKPIIGWMEMVETEVALRTPIRDFSLYMQQNKDNSVLLAEYKQKIRNRRRLAKVSDYLLLVEQRSVCASQCSTGSYLVEMAVIETASENSFSELSTSVGYLLRFPRRTADKQAVRFGIL